jgi:hypothetical protein
VAEDAATAAERLALVSLAAWSDGGEELLAALSRSSDTKLLQPDDALMYLAEATASGTRRVPRLVILDLLVRLAHRRGEQFFSPDLPGRERLFFALGREIEVQPGAGVAAGDISKALQLTLQSTFGLPGLRMAWHQFAERMSEPMALTSYEVNKPMCDDRVEVDGARAIETEFFTDMSVEDLTYWADPRHWPHCSVYFEAMHRKGKLKHVDGGWDGTFVEVVSCVPGKSLETPLEFCYREADDGSEVHTTYDLAEGPTDDILVDNGFVKAEHDTSGPDGTQTRVSALKIIKFTDDSVQQWTSIACDTFWTELLIDMCTDCGEAGHAKNAAKDKKAKKSKKAKQHS